MPQPESRNPNPETRPTSLPNLQSEAPTLGHPSWRPMLTYLASLHARSIHPPQPPLPHPWEEIGPGYCYRPAFGHWDIVHQCLDSLPVEKHHVRHQILNLLSTQTDRGMIPGVAMFQPNGSIVSGNWNISHPQLWPIAVGDWTDTWHDDSLIRQSLDPLIRHIAFLEGHRRLQPEGFYYVDCIKPSWESGIDEGVRFDPVLHLAGQPREPYPCIDATSHAYLLYDYAATWSTLLGVDPAPFAARRDQLARFISENLFDDETGLFHDLPAVHNPSRRRLTFEGFWPLLIGVATPAQAARVIDDNLLNPDRFFTPHPIASVAIHEPAFELRMWRGPSWNSMTYWAARACIRYDRKDAARALLERALNSTAAHFTRTHTVWEFYHPFGGPPETLHRKPSTPFNTPSPDYLGHNPLIAMTRLWQQTL